MPCRTPPAARESPFVADARSGWEVVLWTVRAPEGEPPS